MGSARFSFCVICMNELQINRLSEIFGNLSLLLLASFIIPVFNGQAVDVVTMRISVLLSIFCFCGSIILLRGEKK